jgi:hypothetical protein
MARRTLDIDKLVAVRCEPRHGRRSFTNEPELLAKVDKLASKMGQSRAALVNRTIYELAERVAT